MFSIESSLEVRQSHDTECSQLYYSILPDEFLDLSDRVTRL